MINGCFKKKPPLQECRIGCSKDCTGPVSSCVNVFVQGLHWWKEKRWNWWCMCHKQLPSKSTILTVVPQTSNVKTVASGSPVIPTCYGQHNKTGRQEEHCYLLGLVRKSSCYNVQLSAHSNYSWDDRAASVACLVSPFCWSVVKMSLTDQLTWNKGAAMMASD